MNLSLEAFADLLTRASYAGVRLGASLADVEAEVGCPEHRDERVDRGLVMFTYPNMEVMFVDGDVVGFSVLPSDDPMEGDLGLALDCVIAAIESNHAQWSVNPYFLRQLEMDDPNDPVWDPVGDRDIVALSLSARIDLMFRAGTLRKILVSML